MDSVGAKPQIWDDSIPFYWVVICKNKNFHRQLSRLYSHLIPLGETDAIEPVPALSDNFSIRCDECGKDLIYAPADVMRYQLELPGPFTPHALFR